MTDVVTELTIDARGAEAGSAVYVRAMEAAQRAVDGVIDREAKAQEAIQRQTAVMVTQASSIGRAAREWDRLRQTVDPAMAGMIARQRDLEKAVLVADQAVKRGLATQEQAAAVVAKYRDQLIEASGAVRDLAAANENLNVRMAAQAEIANRVAASQRAAAAQAQINARLGVTTGGGAGRADDIAAYGSALDQLRSRYNPIFAASRQYKESLIEIAQAAKVGAINEQERLAAIAKAKSDLASQVASIKGASQALGEARPAAQAFAAANDNMRRSTGLARHELVNLSRQLQDVGVSLASGQSPLTVLIQQGTQIGDVFASSQGTVGGFFRQILSWVSPTKALAGGIIAIGLATGLAYNNWANEQRELDRALVATGRDAGVTRDRINEIAAASARGQGVSNSQARSTVAALASTGRIAPGMLQPIASVQRDLAATLGLQAADANKLLADSFSDPVRGAEQLGDRLGGLSERTRQYIRRLVETGEAGRAQQVLLDTFAPRLGRAAELTSVWARAWEAVKTGASNAYEAVGRAVERGLVPPAPYRSFADQAEDRLRELEAAARPQVVDRVTGRELGQRSHFGQTQEELQARRQVNVELELQRVTVNAIRSGQEALTAATREQAQAAGDAARNRRTIDLGLQTADRIGGPDTRIRQEYQEAVTRLGVLRAASRLSFESRTGAEGIAEAQRLQREVQAAEAAVRRLSQNSGAGLLNRNGSFRFDPTTPEGMERALGQARTAEQNVLTRAQVERAENEARTVAQQQRAAQMRRDIERREAGAAAGRPDLLATQDRVANDNIARRAQFELSEAYRQRRQAQLDAIEATRAETAALGGSMATQESVRIEQQLINEAKREYRRLGLTIPPAEIEAYRQLAKAAGEARQQQALARAERDARFERQTMFMPEGERRIASTLREIYGDGWQAQQNSVLAGQLRLNEALRQGADYAVDLARGFTQDLRNGVGVLDALGNAFLRVGQRIVDAQIEQLVRSMFNVGGGAGGMQMLNPFGWLGSMFGGGGGGMAGMHEVAHGFDRGGYTGPGGVHQFGGFVHKGEIVWSQMDVARGGGVAAVEAMRLGLRGYAAGGLVGYRPPQVPANGNAPAGHRPVTVNMINAHSAAQVEEQHDGQGNVTLTVTDVRKQMNAADARDIAARRSQVADAMAVAYGLTQRPQVG